MRRLNRCAVLLGVMLVSGGCDSGRIAMPPQDQPAVVGTAEVGKLVSPARVAQQQAEITAALREVLLELEAAAAELAKSPPPVRTQLRAVPGGVAARVETEIEAARRNFEASGLLTEEHRSLLLRLHAVAVSIDATLK